VKTQRTVKSVRIHELLLLRVVTSCKDQLVTQTAFIVNYVTINLMKVGCYKQVQ
jgi:hypothetical protein